VRDLAVRRHLVLLLPLALLVGLSVVLRTRALDASLWIDEGISVGIASHPATEIPGLLRQDGSPPLYYLLLHAWMAVAGTGEAALRAPSLLFALATIPAALWAGRSLFGARAGWLCAVLAAVMPFLTAYAQEVRMYALVALLSVVATAAFLHAFAFRRRTYLAVFAVALILLLYTHYWAFFFALGLLAALAALVLDTPRAERKGLLVDGALAFGIAFVAFLPWLPTFAFQLENTGAPWSNPPPVSALLGAFALGVGAVVLPLIVNGSEEKRALRSLALAAGLALAAAWAAAQLEPGWANRYLAVLVGPLLLLAGLTFARLGPLGLLACAAVSAVWLVDGSPGEKTNVAATTASLEQHLEPGDLVLSTQPEQVPVLAHYLPGGLDYATPLGPVDDPRVMDWRDALLRLERTRPRSGLLPVLDSLPAGSTVLLVRPDVGDGGRWQAPWTSLVVRRTDEWADAIEADGRFRVVDTTAAGPETTRTSIRLTLYRKAG
jgi:mannosyltransferase